MYEYAIRAEYFMGKTEIPHFQENLAEFGADFQKRMQVASSGLDSERIEVVRLERLARP